MKVFKRFLLGLLIVGAYGTVAKAADTVSTTTIRNTGGTWGGRYASILSGASDGTGESMVTKITASGLSGAPTRLKIVDLKWSTYGLNVLIAFDGTSKSTATILSGNGHLSEKELGPIMDPWVAGHTGNILLSTLGATAGDGYTVQIELAPVN